MRVRVETEETLHGFDGRLVGLGSSSDGLSFGGALDSVRVQDETVDDIVS